jgi:catechol 2,3-dioxygenase-like lactoylglutathione lyase family enzyme
MFSDAAAVATVAVRDLAKAKAFYGDVLGLALLEEAMGVATYKTGGSKLFVYESAFYGTNKATSVTFPLKDLAEVAKVAASLKDKGVTFEHYNNVPDLTLDGDVYTGAGMAVAWFTDPDGNILSIVGGA